MNQVCYFATIGLYALVSVADGGPMGRDVQNTIETRVVVDGQAFDVWKRTLSNSSAPDSVRINQTETMLGTFINTVFVGVNDTLAEMYKYGVNLDIRIVGIEFTNDSILSKVYTSRTDVLPVFQQWLNKKKFPTADHTVLLTSRDLTFGSPSYILPRDEGVANPSAMCQGTKSVSAVQLVTNGNTVITLTRQLAISLGAQDNSGNDCYRLPYTTTWIGYTFTKFHFSECSIYDIRVFLQSLHISAGGGCLSSNNTATPKLQGVPMGQRYTPDDICRMTFGNSSYFGRQFYGPHGSESADYAQVCKDIKCAEKGGDLWKSSLISATDGFTCGFEKICRLGDCWPSVYANLSFPAVTNTCPFGDTPSFVTNVYQGMSCQQMIRYGNQGMCKSTSRVAAACCGSCRVIPLAANTSGCLTASANSWCPEVVSYFCYSYANKTDCCATCERFRTSIPGCSFGDKGRDCQKLRCSQCYNASISSRCCGTCKMCEITVPGCKYGDRINGCRSDLCYRSAYNQSSCCGTCNRLQTGRPGCQYGDKEQYCLYLRYPYICYTLDAQCCGTCHRYNTSVPGCTYGDKEKWCSSIEMSVRCRWYKSICCGSCA